MAFPSNPIAGVTLDGLETNGMALGTELTDNLGRKRRLVASGAALSPCFCVSITGANIASALTPTLAINAALIGWVPQSVSCSLTAQNFWAIMNGPVPIRVAASCQPNVPLYTTDTAGVLDDASVSLSQYQVWGVAVDTGSSNSAAAASNLPATASYPMIRHPKTAP